MLKNLFSKSKGVFLVKESVNCFKSFEFSLCDVPTFPREKNRVVLFLCYKNDVFLIRTDITAVKICKKFFQKDEFLLMSNVSMSFISGSLIIPNSQPSKLMILLIVTIKPSMRKNWQIIITKKEEQQLSSDLAIVSCIQHTARMMVRPYPNSMKFRIILSGKDNCSLRLIIMSS